MKPSGFSHRELPVRNGRRADVRLASPGAAGDEAFKKRLTPPFSIDCYGKCNYRNTTGSRTLSKRSETLSTLDSRRRTENVTVLEK
jgi:hypothetical protein